MNQIYWHLLDSSDYQKSYVRTELHVIFLELFFTIVTLSIRSLVAEVKPEVTQHFKFEGRDESNLKVCS